jgi:hypothetical protein
LEVGCAKNGLTEECVTEIDSTEICIVEIDSLEIRSRKPGPGQVYRHSLVFGSPLIPGVNSFFEDLQWVRVCHNLSIVWWRSQFDNSKRSRWFCKGLYQGWGRSTILRSERYGK